MNNSRIEKENELKTIISRFNEEVTNVTTFINVYSKLLTYAKEYQDEITIAPGFFRWTILSYRKNSILELCKLLDVKGKNSVHKFLSHMKKNISLLSKEARKNRVSEPYIIGPTDETSKKWLESLMDRQDEDISTIIIEGHEQMMKQLWNDSDMMKIRTLRDKFHAHLDNVAFTNPKFFQENQVTVEIIMDKLNQVQEIINYYNGKFNRSHHEFGVVRDTRKLFDVLKMYNKHKKKIIELDIQERMDLVNNQISQVQN